MRPNGLRHAIIDRRVGQNSSAQMGRNSLSLPNVSREDVEAKERGFREGRHTQIQARSKQVGDLVDAMGLNDWERRFVTDMRRRASEVDHIVGVQGGGLVTLTDKQIETLERLHEAHAAPQTAAPDI